MFPPILEKAEKQLNAHLTKDGAKKASFQPLHCNTETKLMAAHF